MVLLRQLKRGYKKNKGSEGVSNISSRGGSETTVSKSPGEDNRRGRETKHTSHTPGDPGGVGGLNMEGKDR